MSSCTHLEEIRPVEPSGNGCVECLALGMQWVHLRRCTSCGHIGCCDNSPGKHATAHFHTEAHPIIQSFEPVLVTYQVALPLLFLIVLISGISHSLQSSLADYYRNAYLRFVVDPNKSELDTSSEVRAEYQSISFWSSPFRKFLLRVYLNYTLQQEALSRNFQRLRKRTTAEFGSNIPSWFAEAYRRGNKPLMKYYAILTTNTRMIMMMVCVLSNHIIWYFVGEIVALNLLMVLVTKHQEQLSAFLLQQLAARGEQR